MAFSTSLSSKCTCAWCCAVLATVHAHPASKISRLQTKQRLVSTVQCATVHVATSSGAVARSGGYRCWSNRKFIKGRVSTDIGNMELMGTRLKNIFFWTYRLLQTPRKILQFAVFWVPLSKIYYDVLSTVIGCTPDRISQHYKTKT